MASYLSRPSLPTLRKKMMPRVSSSATVITIPRQPPPPPRLLSAQATVHTRQSRAFFQCRALRGLSRATALPGSASSRSPSRASAVSPLAALGSPPANGNATGDGLITKMIRKIAEARAFLSADASRQKMKKAVFKGIVAVVLTAVVVILLLKYWPDKWNPALKRITPPITLFLPLLTFFIGSSF